MGNGSVPFKNGLVPQALKEILGLEFVMRWTKFSTMYNDKDMSKKNVKKVVDPHSLTSLNRPGAKSKKKAFTLNKELYTVDPFGNYE